MGAGPQDNESAVEQTAERLLELGARELVAIHFPEGAFARRSDGEKAWQCSLSLPKGYVAGAAGAGDAFCAGVLYGIHEGWELERCLLAGTCAAAASLSDPTCTNGVKSLAECLALADQFGIGEDEA